MGYIELWDGILDMFSDRYFTALLMEYDEDIFAGAIKEKMIFAGYEKEEEYKKRRELSDALTEMTGNVSYYNPREESMRKMPIWMRIVNKSEKTEGKSYGLNYYPDWVKENSEDVFFYGKCICNGIF